MDGVAGQLSGVSVEQHVVRCADCRAAVAALVPERPLQLVWAKVLADVEVPRAGLAQRLLHRLGVKTSDSLVIASAGENSPGSSPSSAPCSSWRSTPYGAG
ncbi:MAG TPA: hypothetical protein VES60_11215 [Nakamurella sp.]|nr:hypothetical protein [Nakamurella sp.]